MAILRLTAGQLDNVCNKFSCRHEKLFWQMDNKCQLQLHLDSRPSTGWLSPLFGDDFLDALFQTFRNSSSDTSRLDSIYFLSTFQHFFNTHYIIRGKQLIRLQSLNGRPVLPCRVGPVHSGQWDTSWEASESANRLVKQGFG